MMEELGMTVRFGALSHQYREIIRQVLAADRWWDQEATQGHSASRRCRCVSWCPGFHQLLATRGPDVPSWEHLCEAFPSIEQVSSAG